MGVRPLPEAPCHWEEGLGWKRNLGAATVRKERKKLVTLSADGSSLPTLCRRPDVQGQTALVREETSPSGVMWQGAHPLQPAAGEEEGMQHTCIPLGWRDRRPAGSAQSLAPGRQASWPPSPSVASLEHGGAAPVGCWPHSQGKGPW